MKSFSFILAFLLSFLVVSPVFAAELRITSPQDVQVGQELTLTIQVLDDSGAAVTDAVPELVFGPEFGADEVSFYNCVDPGDSDNCQPNNRDVEGIYESVILVNELPLNIEVSYDGGTSSVRLGSGSATPATTNATTANTTSTPTTSVTPAQVQVGPQPSFWLVVLPFLLMSAVVGYFVVKTE